MLKTANFFLIFSFIIFPILLITGPFLPDLFASVSCLIFILLFKKNTKYFNNYFFIFYIIFSIYLILLSLSSNNYLLSLESSLFYIRFVLFALIIAMILENYKIAWKYISYIFILIFIFLFIDSTIQFIFLKNIFGFEYDTKRLTSVFGEEKILGSYLSRFLPIFILLIYHNFSNNTLINIHYIIIFFLCLIFLNIFFTGERSSLLFGIFSLATYFYLIIKRTRNLIILFILIILALTLLSIINLKISERLFLETLHQLGLNLVFNELMNIQSFSEIFSINYLQINLFSPIYEDFFKTAIKMFWENPIFGIGPKMFREDCLLEIYFVNRGCASHPHNFYIQLLAENGLIGFTIFFSFFIFLLFLFYQNISLYKKNQNNETFQKSFAILSIIIFLFPFVPHGNFYGNWINLLNSFNLGFFIYYFRDIIFHKLYNGS